MALYKVEAINIRSYDLGEADKLVTLYSKERGKIRAVAKGARRIRSRFGGRLELFVRHLVLLHAGKELDQLNQSETIDPLSKIRENIDTLASASYFAWVIDKATEERQVNRPLFLLLQNGLEALAAQNDISSVRHDFQKKFLETEGILPQVGEDLTDQMFQEHFGDYASIKKFMGEHRYVQPTG